MFKRDRARLDALAKRLEDLGESNAVLQKALKALPSELAAMRTDIDLQWEKVQRAIGRLAKRDAAEADATEADGGSSDDQITQMILEGYNPWPTRS